MEGSLQNLSGEYFYSIAALFSASAYILKNILWLRILLVIAAIIYIISGISLGITSMIGWNSAYLLINLSHVVILLLDRVTIALPEETVNIYHLRFSTLSTREHKKLVMNNTFRIFQDDTIINQGESPDRLYIVLRGTVNIVKDGTTLATLDPGDFIGEMSFLTRDGASASAYAENMVQCAFWTHADLEKMKLKNNEVYNKFIAIIGCDLVRKLKHRNDQHIDLITKLDFMA